MDELLDLTYTLSMLDNWSSSDTWSSQKTQPTLSTNHYMATPDEGDLAPTIHYIYELTGRDTDELLELAQDRDLWRELVVESSDLQSPDILDNSLSNHQYQWHPQT